MNVRKAAETLSRNEANLTAPDDARLFLAFVRPAVQLMLYEVPVLIHKQLPNARLLGFVQRAVELLSTPNTTELAGFLDLPESILNLLLANLRQMGAADHDSAGRWRLPQGAPRFFEANTTSTLKERRLLCHWPEADVILPLAPRLRRRDMVDFACHRQFAEISEAYARILNWSREEAARKGLPSDILPQPAEPPQEDWLTKSRPEDTSPRTLLATTYEVDIAGLVWARFDPAKNLWTLRTRLWSRPSGETGASLAAGSSTDSLNVLSWLLDCSSLSSNDSSHLNRLAQIFDASTEDWLTLLPDAQRHKASRNLDSDGATSLISVKPYTAAWIDCTLGSHIALAINACGE